MPSRNEVYSAIDSERLYQLHKWGATADSKPIASMLLYMQHHLNLAIEIASTTAPEVAALDQIRKVAALAAATMERHGAPRRPGF